MKRCAGEGCGHSQLIGRTYYREVAHCWALKRYGGGGTDQVKAAVYTGVALCELCLLETVGPSWVARLPHKSVCDNCGTATPPLYYEIAHCWSKARTPGAHAPTRIRYSGVLLCAACAFHIEQGEQLELFQ
jgi:hypothetical protein